MLIKKAKTGFGEPMLQIDFLMDIASYFSTLPLYLSVLQTYPDILSCTVPARVAGHAWKNTHV
jgi:hypothetical protein